MPNWCTSILIVKGPEELLNDFQKRNSGGKGLSLQALVPMPKELEGSKSPDEPGDTGVAERRAKYGHSNWYDWALANWGCKWDCSPSSVERPSDTELSYTFDTAWSPPVQWLMKVADIFPSLEFEIRYDGGDFYARAWGSHEGWEQEEFTEEQWYEQFNEDYQEQVAFIKALPYLKIIQTYTDPQTNFDEEGDTPSQYRFLDRHILARIEDKDLPLFVAREWYGPVKDEYVKRLKGGLPCTEKPSASPQPTTSTARRKSGRSSKASPSPSPTASSS